VIHRPFDPARIPLNGQEIRSHVIGNVPPLFGKDKSDIGFDRRQRGLTSEATR
jgi:hypothetical protein